MQPTNNVVNNLNIMVFWQPAIVRHNADVAAGTVNLHNFQMHRDSIYMLRQVNCYLNYLVLSSATGHGVMFFVGAGLVRVQCSVQALHCSDLHPLPGCTAAVDRLVAM
jgi:hypothetical protein